MPPDDRRWPGEVKWDGWRALVTVADDDGTIAKQLAQLDVQVKAPPQPSAAERRQACRPSPSH
jgi:hypothetical protein